MESNWRKTMWQIQYENRKEKDDIQFLLFPFSLFSLLFFLSFSYLLLFRFHFIYSPFLSSFSIFSFCLFVCLLLFLLFKYVVAADTEAVSRKLRSEWTKKKCIFITFNFIAHHGYLHTSHFFIFISMSLTLVPAAVYKKPQIPHGTSRMVLHMCFRSISIMTNYTRLIRCNIYIYACRILANIAWRRGKNVPMTKFLNLIRALSIPIFSREYVCFLL